MMGPGKYDDQCTALREQLKAEGVIIIVLGGEKGSGMSAQVTGPQLLALPEILRMTARDMEGGAA